MPKKDYTGVIIGFVCGLIGIGLVIGAIFAGSYYSSIKKRYVKIDGVIDSIERTRDSDGDSNETVYVSYVYDGMYYEHARINFYSSDMYEGKAIKIYVDPKNPRHIVSSGGAMFVPILLGVMGAVFTLVGSCVMTACMKTNRRVEAKLREIAKQEASAPAPSYPSIDNMQNPYGQPIEQELPKFIQPSETGDPFAAYNDYGNNTGSSSANSQSQPGISKDLF